MTGRKEAAARPIGGGSGLSGRPGAEGATPASCGVDALAHNRKLTTVRIDWLAATVRVRHLMIVLRMVSEAVGCSIGEWTERSHGLLGYETMREGPGKARILSSWGRDDIHIILPGQVCGVLSEKTMRSLLGWIEERGAPTRIDVAMDDFGQRHRPRFVREEFDGPTATTRATRSRMSEDQERGGKQIAETAYIGSPKSDRSLKVYDKELESDGRIKAIRWEMVNRRHAAVAVMASLVERSDWGNVFAEFLVGFIDFRVNGDRCAWFRELVADAEAAKIPRPSRRSGLADLVLWLKKYIAPSLALVWAANDYDAEALVRQLALDSQRDRWTPRHRRMLAETLWRRRHKRSQPVHPSRRARDVSKG